MPAPGFSMETTLANERVCRTIEDVTAAWYAVEDAMLGALEHDELGTPHLAAFNARLPVLLHRLEQAERIAHAEVAATRPGEDIERHSPNPRLTRNTGRA